MPTLPPPGRAVVWEGFKAAVLVLPLIAVAAYGVVTSSAVPGPAEMAIFGPAGAHLLTGHWAAVYASAANQGGPFELAPYGVAQLLGLSSAAGWLAYYTVGTFLLTFAVAAAVRVVAPAPSTWRTYRTAAAAAFVCLVDLVPSAFDLGHPAQVMVPVMWVVAACAARDRRFLVAGALVGLSMGWEVWGVLGAPVLFCGVRPRYRSAALGMAAAVAAMYLPFIASGRFAMFSFAWPVRAGTLVHMLDPGLAAFPWTLRLVQAALALAGGVAVALGCRGSQHRVWLVPLTVLGLRLLIDPCLYPYYWVAPGVVLTCGMALMASLRRPWAFGALTMFAVWATRISSRGVADTALLLALTGVVAALCAYPVAGLPRLASRRTFVVAPD